MAYFIDTLARRECRHKLLVWYGFAALGLAACASESGASSREAQLNAGFARIQLHEARVADAQRRIDAADGACPELCAATHDSCEASAAVCAEAQTLGDADALARCTRTRDVCAGDRAEAERCRCAADAK